jgi:hypothetical protein
MSRSAVTATNLDRGDDESGYSLAHSVPLLSVSLVLFGLVTLFTAGAAQPWYSVELFSVQQMSGDRWAITGSDLFLTCSVLMLFAELIKATRTTGSAILNHALSALVFIVALLLFVLRRGFGNSSFFIFTLLTFVDFVAGFIITAISARRDINISRGGGNGG